MMLDDEDGDEDYDRSSSTRKKPSNTRPKRAVTLKFTRKSTRQEWIDGIELKVFEIKSVSLNFGRNKEKIKVLLGTADPETGSGEEGHLDEGFRQHDRL